jgi:hypothetical protein
MPSEPRRTGTAGPAYVTRVFKTSPIRVILAAGAVAGAIGSILTLGTVARGWLHGHSVGVVTTLRLRNVTQLSYGEWRNHENVSEAGVPRSQLRTPGRLISYDIITHGFSDSTRLPVRIIIHDVTHHVSRSISTESIHVTAGDGCGCFDWIAVRRRKTRYYVEVAVFPPGPVRGQPLKTVATGYFGGA